MFHILFGLHREWVKFVKLIQEFLRRNFSCNVIVFQVPIPSSSSTIFAYERESFRFRFAIFFLSLKISLHFFSFSLFFFFLSTYILLDFCPSNCGKPNYKFGKKDIRDKEEKRVSIEIRDLM